MERSFHALYGRWSLYLKMLNKKDHFSNLYFNRSKDEALPNYFRGRFQEEEVVAFKIGQRESDYEGICF